MRNYESIDIQAIGLGGGDTGTGSVTAERANIVEAEIRQLSDFLSRPPYESKFNRGYEPEKISIRKGAVWHEADSQLSISSVYSEPVAVLQTYKRVSHIFETSKPNIFCRFSVPEDGDAEYKNRYTEIELLKYTPNEREKMLESMNSGELREERLDL